MFVPTLQSSQVDRSGSRAGQRGPRPVCDADDRKLSFKTDSGDYLLEGSRAGELRNGAWVIVSYRFGEHVEMALNGEPMRVATHSGRKTTPSFSSQPLLTVGGTNADCSFMGKLAEVRCCPLPPLKSPR